MDNAAVAAAAHSIHVRVPISYDDLQCSVCLELLRDPVTTPCGHDFCAGCLKKCNSKTCPLCAVVLASPQPPKINTRLRSLVEAFEVFEASPKEAPPVVSLDYALERLMDVDENEPKPIAHMRIRIAVSELLSDPEDKLRMVTDHDVAVKIKPDVLAAIQASFKRLHKKRRMSMDVAKMLSASLTAIFKCGGAPSARGIIVRGGECVVRVLLSPLPRVGSYVDCVVDVGSDNVILHRMLLRLDDLIEKAGGPKKKTLDMTITVLTTELKHWAKVIETARIRPLYGSNGNIHAAFSSRVFRPPSLDWGGFFLVMNLDEGTLCTLGVSPPKPPTEGLPPPRPPQ